jgi:hypothetical protein
LIIGERKTAIYGEWDDARRVREDDKRESGLLDDFLDARQADNSDCDEDGTVGTITDPVVIGIESSSSIGICFIKTAAYNPNSRNIQP